jgi:hypothetical protein
MEQKTFYKLLLDLGRSPHKLSRYLKSVALTATEKCILESEVLIHDGKFERAVELMKKAPVSESVMVEAHRRLYLGMALHHLHRHHDADAHLKDAVLTMEFMGLEYSMFLSHFYLFQHFAHAEDFESMRMHLGSLKAIPVRSIQQEVRLLRCQFMYHSELMEFSKAEEYLAILKLKKREMNDTERLALLVNKFKYFIRQDDYVKCQEVLDQLKHQRKFKVGEKYKYMKMLFDHVVKDEPIVVAELTSIKHRVWNQQLRVVRALAVGNEVSAAKHWDHLVELNPDIYGKGFKYHGGKSLFSVCLQKHGKLKAIKTTRKKAA